MKNVKPAFEKSDEIMIEEAHVGKKLVGDEEINCYGIFDINMDGNFTRKA